MITLSVVFEALIHQAPAWAGQVICDVDVDSRKMIPGALFVAVPGEKLDGHDFLEDAFQRGAAFAFIEREVSGDFRVVDLRGKSDPLPAEPLELPFCLRVENTIQALQQVAAYWRKKLNVRVIGITGSVGKSTTKELTATVLKQRHRTLKNPGNLNNEIGLPMTLWRLSEGHDRAVLEMGFYVPGEIEMLCEIARPSVGVITTIGTVHAERAGSIEEIARGKGELVEALPPAPDGVAVLNYDDELVREMADRTYARIFYYGLSPEADLWADQVESLGLDGIKFRLHYQGEIIHLRVPLIGRHSVHTVLRAAAVGLVEGLNWQEIIQGLQMGHTQLRLVAVESRSGALLLDDTYNASPKSMLADLNLLEELDGRKIAVLGDMLELGQYERIGHEKVGIRAAEIVHTLVTVGPLAKMMGRAAEQAGMPEDRIVELQDSEAAVDFLEKFLMEGDMVLIKGSRGARMDRIVTALEVES
jgi:UDP-N-acetylmuramoyl-tripeptide--D-alanyl-D-alanine ligase